MSPSLLLTICVLLSALVAAVGVGALSVFDWPAWASTLLYAALFTALGLALAAANYALRGWQSRALFCMQTLATVGLIAAAAALTEPAWRILGGGGGETLAAGRMAPMFAAALLLYAINLWLDAAQASEERELLQRLTRLLSGPRLLPALVTALLLTAAMILALDWLARVNPDAGVVTRRFLERGIIPPLTVLLFFWGLLLLLGKHWNARYLRRALQQWRANLQRDDAPLVDSITALSAGAAPPDETVALLWQRYEESYLFPRYLSWAVPVLGFIGTVLGISLAADGIRRIIGSDTGLSGLSADLSGAIAPLGIAFDTTLIALSLSVALTLLLSLVQRFEERVLSTLEWEVRSARRAK